MGKPRKYKPKPTENRSCLGKIRYETFEAAAIASRRPAEWVRRHGYMQPYACRYCGGYHYGHPIRRN